MLLNHKITILIWKFHKENAIEQNSLHTYTHTHACMSVCVFVYIYTHISTPKPISFFVSYTRLIFPAIYENTHEEIYSTLLKDFFALFNYFEFYFQNGIMQNSTGTNCMELSTWININNRIYINNALTFFIEHVLNMIY